MNAKNIQGAAATPQGNAQLAKVEPPIVRLVRSDGAKTALSAALPKHVSVDRMVRVVLTAIGKNPDLLKCDRDSVWSAVLQAAELGLEPGGALGHAYLIPYKSQCQLVIGYRGMIALARRSAEIESLEAHVVYEKDTFKLAYGLDSMLEHVPYLDGDPGAMRLAYAVAKLRGGGVQFEVMTRSQIEKIRDRGGAKLGGPWKTDAPEMWRKTVIRRLFKLLPMSVELVKVYEREDEDGVLEGEFIPGDTVPAGSGDSRTDQLAGMLGEGEAPAEGAPEQTPDQAPATT